MFFGLDVFSFQVLKQRLTQGFSALLYLFFLFPFSLRQRNQSGQTAFASRGTQEAWHLQDGLETFWALCVFSAKSQQPSCMNKC